MDPSLTVHWRVGTGLWVASAAMACFAAFVAAHLARGMSSTNRFTAGRTLVGAALALSTGCWAAHFIAMSRGPLPFTFSYSAIGAFLALLACFVFSLAGLWLHGHPSDRWSHRVLAALALGTGASLGPALGLHALSAAPELQWDPAVLALGWVAACGLSGLAAFAYSPRRNTERFWLRQAVASVLLGGGMLVANAALLNASSVMALTTRSLTDADVSGGLLTALATLCVPSLLALLLLSSVVEARMRATLRRTREELLVVAQTDHLTGLPNRTMFEMRLQRAATRADREDGMLALLFVNLDGLKTVNESFGQAVGDDVLREIASRLRDLAAPQDVVARAGGDEFLVLLDGAPSVSDASHLARRLLKALGEPCVIDGREMSITSSVGITMYPEHGALSTLITHAAAAMHAAKRNGGATYCFFEASMVAGARDQVDLLRDLRRAIEHGELEVYYQPKIHAPSGQITGAEALMRWHHPQRGMVGPNIFIPLAERFGLINAMGNWLIEDVCRQIRAWRDGGLRMRVSINLSVHQLRQEDLVERLTAALARKHIEPQVLTCEITESVAMEDTRAILKVIERLSAAGVHLSIDDFGTGYSSLSYLRQLAAGELKIDRSFVLDLETSADARAIVDAVVKLAQALGLKVVAEGVETEAQQKILRLLGCDELQGFLFAKPMSAKALTLWAMEDDGPRSLVFRPSLFGDTLSPTVA